VEGTEGEMKKKLLMQEGPDHSVVQLCHRPS